MGRNTLCASEFTKFNISQPGKWYRTSEIIPITVNFLSGFTAFNLEGKKKREKKKNSPYDFHVSQMKKKYIYLALYFKNIYF